MSPHADQRDETFERAVEREKLDTIEFAREHDGVQYFSADSPDGQVVIEHAPGEYAEVTPTNEWLFDSWTRGTGMRDWLGDADPLESFTDTFWKRTPTLKHATDPGNAAGIILDGELRRGNETRGMGNRSVGKAVFTTEDGHISIYGNAVFEIDTDSMDDDGRNPAVEKEPEVIEEERRELIASMVNYYGYRARIPGDVSPDTRILYADVPLKYLSLDAGAGTIENIVDYVVGKVQNGAYSASDGQAAIDWLEGQNNDPALDPVYADARDLF